MPRRRDYATCHRRRRRPDSAGIQLAGRAAPAAIRTFQASDGAGLSASRGPAPASSQVAPTSVDDRTPSRRGSRDRRIVRDSQRSSSHWNEGCFVGSCLRLPTRSALPSGGEAGVGRHGQRPDPGAVQATSGVVRGLRDEKRRSARRLEPLAMTVPTDRRRSTTAPRRGAHEHPRRQPQRSVEPSAVAACDVSIADRRRMFLSRRRLRGAFLQSRGQRLINRSAAAQRGHKIRGSRSMTNDPPSQLSGSVPQLSPPSALANTLD